MKADGLKIEIVLGDGSRRNVREELKIDLSQLSEELMDQPSWYAYYGSLLAEAEVQLEEGKAEYDSLVGEVSSEIRAKGGPTKLKVTEKQVALDTEMDSRVRGSRARLIGMKKTYVNLKVLVRAFDQRMEALKSLSHVDNRNRNQDPTVRSDSFDSSLERRDSRVRTVDTSKLSTKEEYMKELEEIRASKGKPLLKGKKTEESE